MLFPLSTTCLETLKFVCKRWAQDEEIFLSDSPADHRDQPSQPRLEWPQPTQELEEFFKWHLFPSAAFEDHLLPSNK